MERFISDSPEETVEIGKKIASYLKAGDCVLYTGEMGAGKTHLTKGIAEYFGSTDDVTSPTFALVNEYEGDVPIFHFDLFRINTLDDLYAIGFFDYLDAGGVLVIEWSENVLEFLPKDMIRVDIKRISDNEREITVKRGEKK